MLVDQLNGGNIKAKEILQTYNSFKSLQSVMSRFIIYLFLQTEIRL